MNPLNYKYTREHEWISPEGNKAKIGITHYAQKQLGDVVYVNIRPPGTEIQQFGVIGEIESVKAVAELFAPVSGKILEINPALIEQPQLVNQDPYGEAWLAKIEIKDLRELDALMSAEEYNLFEANLVRKEAEER